MWEELGVKARNGSRAHDLSISIPYTTKLNSYTDNTHEKRRFLKEQDLVSIKKVDEGRQTLLYMLNIWYQLVDNRRPRLSTRHKSKLRQRLQRWENN